MKKIGIMGGTFNPIHNAHLMIAQAACEQFQLDEVWFMPLKKPPHKSEDEIVSEEHRCRMVQFAIDDIGPFSLSDMELKRKGTTYTCETLAQCVEEYPQTKFYFILGGDSLKDFDKWFCPQEIVRLCTVLAVSRGTMSEEELARRCQQLSAQFHGDFLPVSMPTVSISSEEIRGKLRRHESVAGYVPEKVCRYIGIHGLYGADFHSFAKKEKELLADLAATLRPERYLHTLGVAYTAANLAACFMDEESDVKKARKAGLLHDCAKYLTDKEMFTLCDKYGVSLTQCERENPPLVHGKLGAYLAKHRYGMEDDICLAIACHTTGKPEMTTLEKILYVADFIEPRRKLNSRPYSLSEVRKQSFRNLEQGLFMTLENTVNYLQRTNIPIDELTFQTYNYYKNKRNNKQ